MFLRPFFHYNKPINLPRLYEAVKKDNAADTAERRNYDKLCYTPDSRRYQLVYP